MPEETNQEEKKLEKLIVLSTSRNNGDGGHHSSGWKVALADLMTSLFASFLVLWLMASTTPEGRAEIASVFKYPSITPKELGRTENKDTEKTTGTSSSLINKSGGKNSSKEKSKHTNKDRKNKRQESQDKQKNKSKTVSEIHKALAEKLRDRLGNHATMTFTDNEIVIMIKGDTLYKPGGYQATPKDEEIIMDIADILVDTTQIIRIEGHTDNTSTNSTFVETNFELSSLRAARIAWIFNVVGVEGTRIIPKGLGENFPIASNKTVSGRAKNRRVIITINDDSIFDDVTRESIFND